MARRRWRGIGGKETMARVRKLLHTRYRVEEKGVKLSDGPTKSSGMVFAFIDAPEGYEIELIQ